MPEDAATYQPEPKARTIPANTWIVSAYEFRRHRSLEIAQRERDRLAAQVPYKTFTIYRLKSTLEPSDARRRRRLDRAPAHGDVRMGEPEAGGALHAEGQPEAPGSRGGGEDRETKRERECPTFRAGGVRWDIQAEKGVINQMQISGVVPRDGEPDDRSIRGLPAEVGLFPAARLHSFSEDGSHREWRMRR